MRQTKTKKIAKFFKDLTSVLKKENLDTEKNIIVGGDFNCPINPIIAGQKKMVYWLPESWFFIVSSAFKITVI